MNPATVGRLARALGWAIVGLGIAHVLATPEFVPELGVPGLWFASAGGAFVLVGALNLLRARYATVAPDLTRVCLLANLGTFGFLIALAVVAQVSVATAPQVFVALLRPGRVDRVRGLGLAGQAGEPPGGKGTEGVADGLHGAAEGRGNPGGALPFGAGQEDLAAAQGEGIGGA